MTDFKDVMGKFVEFEPQLVLLDIVLPFFNGFHWCQEIRKISKVPIIFLSSANDNMNIVMAMNMGGDEFIEKPFDLNVVTAKVQAVLRRTYEFRGTADVMEWNGAVIADLSRAFLNTNGAVKHAGVRVARKDRAPLAQPRFSSLREMASSLRCASRRGLVERFDTQVL